MFLEAIFNCALSVSFRPKLNLTSSQLNVTFHKKLKATLIRRQNSYIYIKDLVNISIYVKSSIGKQGYLISNTRIFRVSGRKQRRKDTDTPNKEIADINPYNYGLHGLSSLEMCSDGGNGGALPWRTD